MNDELEIVFLKKLGRAWDMEDRLVARLPLLAEAATSIDLRAALNDHLEETVAQRERLEKICKDYDYGHDMDQSQGFRLMLDETETSLAGINDLHVRDAFIIASAQSVEHLEMAKYGTLIAWAKELEDEDAEELLKETLDEEKKADALLSKIAKGGIFKTGVNEKAAK